MLVTTKLTGTLVAAAENSTHYADLLRRIRLMETDGTANTVKETVSKLQIQFNVNVVYSEAL